MGIVIGAVAVVFVLALIIFPGVRGKLKVLVGGFLNIFVEDIAKTPEGAKAVFQQAIEEVQERYNKAGDTLNRFVGEQSSVQKNLNKLYGELKDVESKCESLVRSGNMADAAIFSTRREEILFEISQKEGYLREIEPMVKEAQTVYEAYDKKLRELKKQSRMTVEEMKLRGNMKDLLGDLDELRRDSATDKLLGSVRDGAEDLRKEVDGAIVVHASRATTKMSMAEKNAAKAQSDAYLQSLATKYNGKPAIQAPRSGVTFDAPKSKVKEERK
jgi:phage shock protein A